MGKPLIAISAGLLLCFADMISIIHGKRPLPHQSLCSQSARYCVSCRTSEYTQTNTFVVLFAGFGVFSAMKKIASYAVPGVTLRPFAMELSPLYVDDKDAGVVFSVSRLLGLFVLSSRGDFSTFRCVLSFLLITTSSVATVSAVVVSLMNHVDSTDPTDNFWSATEFVRVSLDILTVFAYFFTSTTNRKRLRRCYVRVANIKMYRVMYKETVLVVALFMFRTASTFVQVNLAEHTNQTVDVTAGNLIAYMYFNTTLIVIQMTTMVEAIRAKFDEFLQIAPQHYLQTDRHSKTVDYLTETVLVYDVTLLLYTLRSLIELTSLGFYNFVTLYKTITLKSKWYTAYSVVNLTSLGMVLAGLLILVRTCEKTAEQMELFYKELFRQMRESKALCTNKKLCLYVSMRKTVNFTACGFFNLGYPLITSIVAAATTYLVILVQFTLDN